MVLSVYAKTEDGLHAGSLDLGDLHVQESAVGKLGGDPVGVGVACIARPEVRERTLYARIRAISVRNRTVAVHNDDIAWGNLVDQFPQQRGHTSQVHQAQERMITRTRDLVTVYRRHGVGLVLTRVEQSVSHYGISVPVQHFQIDHVVTVGNCTLHDVGNRY